ncbi:solute carrier family 22 member 4-like isoform X1 [Melanaphis sacchari]|uniref:solute carrier family 22 member 4-like isoform X1 n=2 Tax=Melanaphis sacchari TaxID=742174 RepID=UPI000DC14B38|nr:solute carrier family 22 member 4-like isoform X1 [Melanaphis sacchari]XP_025199408.1 solute carrier family 22 member 4-like isoform X1 [Melanaphis sacchari]
MSYENKPGTTQIMILQLENDIKGSNEFHEDDKKKCDKGTKDDINKIEATPADFETAISHTGYGIYNKRMLVLYIPLTLTSLFCTSSPSFILPAVRCYFDLSPLEEGSLFGAVYVGMVSSAFVWGFLIDTLGRQKLLFYGILLSGIMEFLSGFVQRFWVLVVLKFFCGVATCGPYSLAFTFLSEFYDKEHRDKIVLYAGGFSSFAFVLQPLVAYFLIPMDINLQFLNGYLIIDNWRVFLITCSIMVFLAAFLVYTMDESPKFLMAVGRHKEALNVFKKIYSQNTGNPPESYPISVLRSELSEEQSLKSMPSITITKFIRKGWIQIKPFFLQPYLTPSSLTFLLLFMTMLTLNTFRLRLPNMYATIIAAKGDHSLSVCESRTSTNVTYTADCKGTLALVDPEIYIKSMIVGSAVFSMFWVAIYITKYMDKNYIYIIFSVLGGISISIFPWTNGIVTLTLSAIYVAIMNINTTLVISIMASAVPTTLRGMAVNMVIMFGRIGVVFGNLIIPVLDRINCELPYMTLATFNFLGFMVILLLMRLKKEKPKIISTP